MNLTPLEQSAILLAAELELTISTMHLPHAWPGDLIQALNNFRKAQVTADGRIGADLEQMQKQYLKVFSKTGT